MKFKKVKIIANGMIWSGCIYNQKLKQLFIKTPTYQGPDLLFCFFNIFFYIFKQIDAGNLRAVRVPVRDDSSSGGSSERSSISSDVTICYAESSPNDTIDQDSHGNDDLDSDTDGSHVHDDLDGIVPLL